MFMLKPRPSVNLLMVSTIRIRACSLRVRPATFSSLPRPTSKISSFLCGHTFNQNPSRLWYLISSRCLGCLRTGAESGNRRGGGAVFSHALSSRIAQYS